METINLDEEWDFIIKEVHKEKPNKDNLLKRELLFILELLLSKNQGPFNQLIYVKSKEMYLGMIS